MYNKQLIDILPNLKLHSLDPLVQGKLTHMKRIYALPQSKTHHFSKYGSSNKTLGTISIGSNSFFTSLNSLYVEVGVPNAYGKTMDGMDKIYDGHALCRTKTTNIQNEYGLTFQRSSCVGH